MPKGEAPTGRPMTWVWMILALVVVGGFLTYLGIASEPTTVVVVEEDVNDVDVDPDAAVTIPRDTLAEDRSRFLGDVVRVEGVASTGRLGPGIFWGELGDIERQIPILVRLDAELVETVEIQSGVEYTITGQIQRVSDELVSEWAAQGEFAGEGEEFQATFADYYIQASAVRPSMR